MWHCSVVCQDHLTHWGINKMVDILPAAFSFVCLWMESIVFWFDFLNYCWSRSMMLYGVTRSQWVNQCMDHVWLQKTQSNPLTGSRIICSKDAKHYNDVIMTTMAHQITSITVVCLTVYSGTGQTKHQSFASLAFVRGIHRWPVNSPHKGPVTRKMFPFDDVIMKSNRIN